jgi:hypothetical protein
MTGKEMIDLGSKIIKRQDLDRDLLLFFINAVRRNFLRTKNLRKFYKYLTNIPHNNGVVDLQALKIKYVRSVEWEIENTKINLDKLVSYEDAIDIYHSLTKVGTPKHYLEIGSELYLLPAPVEGNVNIYGDVLPDDILDDVTSFDAMTLELGEAWVYLSCAEYFDMLNEQSQGNYWRTKGTSIIGEYITQSKIEETNNIELMNRDPWGNNPSKYPTKVVFDTVVVDDLDGGPF